MSFYDRQGQPMTRADWARRFGSADRIVDRTTLSDGRLVSTIWLGRDLNFTGDGPPLIFETMVFGNNSLRLIRDMKRYSTEAEAKAGHEVMVKKWSPA